MAAARLVAEKGYDGFSLADVGENAGYSRGLPAHYFGKRDDLLRHMTQTIVKDFYDGFSLVPSSEKGLPSIVALIRFHASSLKTQRVRALVILLANSLVDSNLEPTIRDLNESFLSFLEEKIYDGVKVGNIQSDVDVKLQAQVIHAFLRGQMGFAAFEESYKSDLISESFISMLELTIGQEA